MKKNNILFFPIHPTSWDGMFPIIQNLDKKKVFKLEILVCNSYIHKKSKEHPNIANYIHLYENNLIVTFKSV